MRPLSASYTFDGPRMPRTMAHEITHLVFHEYMGASSRLVWFNDGLAVYEELRAAPRRRPARARGLAGPGVPDALRRPGLARDALAPDPGLTRPRPRA